MKFELDDFTQYRLLNGLDDVGLTLRHADAIDRVRVAAPGVVAVGRDVARRCSRRSGGGLVDVDDLVRDPHVGELVRELGGVLRSTPGTRRNR